MHNIKLIRMQTGEDIMASLKSIGTKQVQLDDPMRLIFRRLPTGQTIMMMMPWLPVELIKQNSAVIYQSDIVTTIEPKEAMVTYYDRLVTRTNEDMADADKLLEELLEEHEPEYEEDDGALTQDQLEQIINDVKSKKLH